MTSALIWTFHGANALSPWDVPASLRPSLVAGTLWIRAWRTEGLDDPLVFAWPRFDRGPVMRSPTGLAWSRASGAKLRLVVRNGSPETDLLFFVATTEAPQTPLGPIHVPLRPYETAWQEVVAHLDEIAWTGTLDRFWIRVPSGLAGDLFFRSIALEPGAPRQRPAAPDIRGELPQLDAPGLAQDHVADAFAILQDAVVHDPLPINGFPAPFLAPGAHGAFYGNNWWVLDASLAMHPLLWTAPGFCEQMMLGFADMCERNPDGCMQHEGKIARRGLPCALSVIPRVFEAWAAIARTSSDPAVRQRCYSAMARHLEWWLSPIKQDAQSGLVTAVFEESFTHHHDHRVGRVAPVDTNVAVAVGARLCAGLAEELGLPREAARHRAAFAAMAESINRVLWNDDYGCYLNWLTQEKTHRPILANHAFDPLRLGIVPPERRQRLFARLLDPEQFGWNRLGLTTIARQDHHFTVAVGPYDGRAWNGDIWTMRNHVIIQGLRECGEREHAAELAWHTLGIFAGRCAEYLEPDGGTPHGVARYAWTAGQWLQILIEEIFGLRYHGASRTLSLEPMIPAALTGQTLTLRRLRLPDRDRTAFDLSIHRQPDGLIATTLTAATVPAHHRLACDGTAIPWTAGASQLQREMAHR